MMDPMGSSTVDMVESRVEVWEGAMLASVPEMLPPLDDTDRIKDAVVGLVGDPKNDGVCEAVL